MDCYMKKYKVYIRFERKSYNHCNSVIIRLKTYLKLPLRTLSINLIHFVVVIAGYGEMDMHVHYKRISFNEKHNTVVIFGRVDNKYGKLYYNMYKLNYSDFKILKQWVLYKTI